MIGGVTIKKVRTSGQPCDGCLDRRAVSEEGSLME
jgi:hypothetical protein